jgi:hypothetical protein
VRLTVSAAIDQEAALGELLDAALHMATCRDCGLFLGEINAISRVLRSTELSRTGPDGTRDGSSVVAIGCARNTTKGRA